MGGSRTAPTANAADKYHQPLTGSASSADDQCSALIQEKCKKRTSPSMLRNGNANDQHASAYSGEEHKPLFSIHVEKMAMELALMVGRLDLGAREGAPPQPTLQPVEFE